MGVWPVRGECGCVDCEGRVSGGRGESMRRVR